MLHDIQKTISAKWVRQSAALGDMEITRLNKFQDNKLLDEVMISNCSLEISIIGKARYQFSIYSGEVKSLIHIWTSQKGQIDTRIEIDDNVKGVTYLCDKLGVLENLSCFCKSFHLEHMDRGHYWLCIYTPQDSFAIHFTTRGYLKTEFVPPYKSLNQDPTTLAPIS